MSISCSPRRPEIGGGHLGTDVHDTDDNPHHPCVGGDARVHRLVLKKMVNVNPMCSDNRQVQK